MKFFKLFSVFLLLLCSFSLSAQSERIFTMDEAIMMIDNQSKQSLRVKSIPMLQWIPNSNQYTYVKTGSSQRLFIVNIDQSTIDSSFSLSVFNEYTKAFDAKMVFKGFPAHEWVDNQTFKFKFGTKYFTFNLTEKLISELVSVSEKGANLDYDNNKNQVAYTENGQIFISSQDGGVKQVTTDGGKGVVYGETVHRNEFGISKGLFWSPKGNKLAFYRMDETMVTDYPIYDNSTFPAKVNNIKYPMAGAASHHVTIGIYDLKTQTTVYLQTGEPADQYLTNVTWSPNEESIYVTHVNRGQNQMFLRQYIAENGELDKIVFEERDAKYVEPQHGMYFLPNDDSKFIWQSERDGYNHLYLYSTKGRLIKQLTSGKWIVTNLFGVDPAGNQVFFESTKESPVERHVYSVNINTSELKQLSVEQGTHSAFFNSNFTYFIDNFSSTTVPRKISIISHKGDVKETLLRAPNPIADYLLGETTIFPIVNDGHVLYCRMTKPPQFDPNKKYPVVVYVYGGPHAQMVNNTWLAGGNLWMQLMAQKGYIVFTLDNRGSANRGHEFESANFRNMGTVELDDQMAGVNYLKNLSYVDKERMAVHGWSYGGFMTTSLMTKRPGVFKVGVAGGPVIDWALYEIMYTERYMDSPSENPEGYKNANLLNHINNLQDNLLMIHGCDDDVVLWQHSLLYSKAAVDAGNTYLDYFVYPGHKHNVMGKDRIHLMQKITEYIMEKL